MSTKSKKRLPPLFIAIIMFVCTVLGGKWYLNDRTEKLSTIEQEWMRYDLSGAKQSNPELLRNLLDENTLLLLGSSELSTIGESTHPIQFYADGHHNFDLLLMGQGYAQSLTHTITMGALGEHIPNKKVALILSPQWFTAEHIDSQAFASVFRVELYESMLQSKSLSKESKCRISDRCHTFLSEKQDLNKKMTELENIYLYDSSDLLNQLAYRVGSWFRHKQKQLILLERINSYRQDTEKLQNRPTATSFSFDERLLIAEAEGSAAVTNNDFGVDDIYFNTYMKNSFQSRKDEAVGDSYLESKEYDDLTLFLDVCKELNIEVLLISVPVNGTWYDYTGFPKEERQDYYEKIRQFSEENEVELLDLSSHEYTKYFLRDIMHLGWKGWVYIEEGVESFYHKD